jgi:hypothetical protein
VQDSIYDKFVALLVQKAKELVIGDGFDEKSGGGPVVSSLRLILTSLAYDVTLHRSLRFNTTKFGDISRMVRLRVRSLHWAARNAQAKGFSWMRLVSGIPAEFF